MVMTIDPRIKKPLYWCDSCGQDAPYGFAFKGNRHACGPHGCKVAKEIPAGIEGRRTIAESQALQAPEFDSPGRPSTPLTLAEEIDLEEAGKPVPPAPKRRSKASPPPTNQGSLF